MLLNDGILLVQTVIADSKEESEPNAKDVVLFLYAPANQSASWPGGSCRFAYEITRTYVSNPEYHGAETPYKGWWCHYHGQAAEPCWRGLRSVDPHETVPGREIVQVCEKYECSAHINPSRVAGFSYYELRFTCPPGTVDRVVGEVLQLLKRQ